MVEVGICVGSSCHMKRSYRVVQTFKEMAQEHGVSDKINIKASFCMKNCVNGISTSVDGQLISGVNISNAPDRFLEFILPKAVSDNS